MGVNNGTVSLHAWFVLLSQTGSFFTGGERFMPHEGGNPLMLQGWLLGPLLFHMSQGRTPAGNLNAYFSILKKLMNTASMAKHFNQPLPAVPTSKKRKMGRGNAQVYQKKFLRKINHSIGCVRGRGREERRGRRKKGRRVPVPSAKGCALAPVFVEQIKHVLVFHLLK